MFGQAVFNRRRGHVFAFAGLENFLEASGQAQATVRVLLALVTRAQEAICGERIRGFLRVLEVAQHGRATVYLHFA